MISPKYDVLSSQWSCTDIFINQRIELYLNSTINVRPLTPHIMPCYTHRVAVVSWPQILWRHFTLCIQDVLHWLPVQQRTEYKVSLLIYKCLHQAAPLYLTEMCVPVSATQRRHGLRSAVRGDLEVPRCNLARYGQRSFNVSGPSLSNSLPLTVRDSSLTLTQFCTRLKTFLFTRA